MKRYCFLIVLLAIGLSSAAQRSPFINAQYLGGVIMPHREGMEALKNKPVNGVELEVGLHLHGNEDWHVAYDYPMTGFGLHYSNLGYKDVLGYAAGFYGFIEVPLKRWSDFELMYRLTSGLTYVSEVFSVEDNPLNVAVSTHANYLFHTGLRARYWMSPETALGLGAGLTHYSNGAISKPNKGLNQINIALGITHYLSGQYDAYQGMRRPLVYDSEHEFYLLGVGGWTDLDKGFTDPDNPGNYGGTNQTYFTGGVSLGWNYRYAGMRKVGLSFDGFYNRSFNWSWWDGNFYDRNLTKWQMTRLGIGINHEFFMKRLSILIGAGVYVKQTPEIEGLVSKSKEWMYERLGFRYYFIKNAFLNVSVKAYGFKAETVEFGVGFSLNNMYE
ncbi:MAG TPA: acyloxyacyl hydrolase [Bacteroidales bacterium]|nr:acyloxyacyl hydrolase [Bacteroidales bacterium]